MTLYTSGGRLKLISALFVMIMSTFICTSSDAAAPPSPGRSTWQVSASSFEANLDPKNASDGNSATRWGSRFTDSEWWQADFGKSRDIVGVKISWEAAYGRDYDVLLSADGLSWKTAYTVRDGDGGTDELLFGLRKARYLKIQGLKRGTGWGYSLWEIDVLGRDFQPFISAGSDIDGNIAPRIMDGDTETFWMSKPVHPQGIIIDFLRIKSIGGVEILWNGEYASHYTISASNDLETWKDVAEVTDGDGGYDIIFFPGTRARRFRIICRDGPEKRFSIREILVKSGDEALSPMRFYESLRTRMPEGALPAWLSRRQTFWTVTGVPRDDEESLIGEEGTIEPFSGGFTVTPFMIVDGAARTHFDFDVRQELQDRWMPLPSVRWAGHGLALDIQAVSFGDKGKSATAVRYTVTNTSQERLRSSLCLAVRPLQLNPPWQYGGVSRIDTAEFTGGGRELSINGRRSMISMSAPDASFLSGSESGDVFSSLAQSRAPESRGPARKRTDSKGLLSAAMKFDMDLEPGKSKSAVVVYPLHPASGATVSDKERPSVFFDRIQSEQTHAWRGHIGDWHIDIPDTRMLEIARSSLAYMLINADGPTPKPGPRNYAKIWARDGALMSVAYLKYGLMKEAREFVDWIDGAVNADGDVPFIVDPATGRIPDWAKDWNEYDAQGQFVYILRQYYEFTRDTEMLRRIFPQVLRVLARQQALIDRRKTDSHATTPYFGLLPESNSHEGYFPAMHSYWDDFFAIRGFKDGAALADALADHKTAERFRMQESMLRKDVHASLRAVIARDKIGYIPGCVEKGDFDATSTSIALNACDERESLLADDILGRKLTEGYDRYLDEIRPRTEGKGVWASFTPYEVRNIEALVRLGRRDDAIGLMRFFTGEPVRPHEWNLMAEVVHFDRRTGSYIGDMPHTWVASDYLQAFRALFVYEEGERLVLGAGIPDEWLDTTVTVRLPTAWGRIEYSLKKFADGSVILDVAGPASPPHGFSWKHPLYGRKISVSGGSARIGGKDNEEILFSTLPAKIVLRAK